MTQGDGSGVGDGGSGGAARRRRKQERQWLRHGGSLGKTRARLVDRGWCRRG